MTGMSVMTPMRKSLPTPTDKIATSFYVFAMQVETYKSKGSRKAAGNAHEQ